MKIGHRFNLGTHPFVLFFIFFYCFSIKLTILFERIMIFDNYIWASCIYVQTFFCKSLYYEYISKTILRTYAKCPIFWKFTENLQNRSTLNLGNAFHDRSLQ